MCACAIHVYEWVPLEKTLALNLFCLPALLSSSMCIHMYIYMGIHVCSTLAYVKVGRKEWQQQSHKHTLYMHIYTSNKLYNVRRHKKLLEDTRMPSLENWDGGGLKSLANSPHTSKCPLKHTNKHNTATRLTKH